MASDKERLGEIEAKKSRAEETIENTTWSARMRLSDRDVLTVRGQKIHVGDGLDHMSSLIHIVEQANAAGEFAPLSVMRDDKHQPKKLWTHSAKREVLRAAAARENVVESAHNQLIPTFHAAISQCEDEALSLDNREKAVAKALDIANRYQELLTAGIAAFDPDELPDDLPTLKQRLTELLEAAATGHQEDLKGGLTQQAIDNWASCIDQDGALQKIAEACALASIEITRASTADEAKAAHEAGVTAIQAVKAANTPIWDVDGTDVTAAKHAVPATMAVVTAKHPPSDQPIPGNVAITGYSATYADGRPARISVVVQAAQKAHRATIKLKGGETRPVTVLLAARNLCGPSDLKVTIAAPKS